MICGLENEFRRVTPSVFRYFIFFEVGVGYSGSSILLTGEIRPLNVLIDNDYYYFYFTK